MDTKANLLLVEDSPVQGTAIKIALTKSGYEVDVAKDAEEALQKLRGSQPQLILTDLTMPGMSGLELLKIVRHQFPDVPVILMTGDGSEEVAAEALKSGAASYVSKDRSMGDLEETISRVIQASTTAHSFTYLQDSIEQCHYRFRLKNDRALLVSVTQFAQFLASRAGVVSGEDRRNLGVALEETLLNSLYHGNLEVPQGFRDMEQPARSKLVEQRTTEEPFASRTIQLTLDVTADEFKAVVVDDGPGFDFQERFAMIGVGSGDFMVTSGMRGLILIHMFMDEVEFLGRGNEVHLIKRR